MRKNRFLCLLLVCLLLLGMGSAYGEENKPESLTVICTTDDVAYFEYAGALFEEQTGVKINLVSQNYDDTKTKVSTSVAGGVADIAYVDVVWPAEFAAMGILLPLDEYITPESIADVIPATIDQLKFQGSTYGVPFANNGKWMFYNKKMLADGGYDAPPTTWDELKAMSIDLQQKGICKYGIAWAGVQAEGLLCDMTTMLSAFGGAWTDEEGKMTFNSEAGVNALNFMRQSIEEGWADPASTTYTDRDALDPFIAGDTPFVMNWSFAWVLSNDPSQSQVAGNVGVCLIPGTENVVSGSVTGGGGLGVLSCTKYPEYAWKFLELCLSYDVQLNGLENCSTMPCLNSLFEDPAIQEKYEYLAMFYPQFAYAKSRPAVARYSEWSNILQQAISSVLIGETDAKTALDTAFEEIQPLF